MNIVHVAAEAAPFVVDGSLGQHVGSLIAEQVSNGHEVSLILPGYRSILDSKFAQNKEKLFEIVLSFGDRREKTNVFKLPKADGISCYIITRSEYFDRQGVYGTSEGRLYDDNDRRFIYFARAAVQALTRLELDADIVHAHEWHTGLVPAMILYEEAKLVNEVAEATAFTIHDIRYQGVFPASAFGLTGLPQDAFTPDTLEFYGQINLLKAGILYADGVSVHGNEAVLEELLSPTADHGLLGLLRSRRKELHPIDLDSDNASGETIALYESLQ